MRTLAFLDCPTGISGDMCLGAIVSAGVPLSYLQEWVARLNLPETVELKSHIVRKNEIAATKVDVILPHETDPGAHHPPARPLAEIKRIIRAAELPERVTAWSLAVFQRLAIAEGSVHGVSSEEVHFHEVGATDAIVDIVGTCLGLDWLGIDELYCAALPTGRGTVRAAHGRLPVPVPAVLKLMEMSQVPIHPNGLEGEMVTPTGAAIATELAAAFGDPPKMTLQKVGLGAGNKDFAVPNILRLWLGHPVGDRPQSLVQSTAKPHHPHSHHSHEHPSPNSADYPDSSKTVPASQLQAKDSASNLQELVLEKTITTDEDSIEQRSGPETVVLLETQVDDLSPQAIGYLYDRLLAVGALDVFTQSVMMKKSRLGHLITVIAYPEQADDCERCLLAETTTLGVRRSQQTRLRMRREIVLVETPLGPIRMKLAYYPGSAAQFKAHPEYEDCAALAQKHRIPWREVHEMALHHWHEYSAKLNRGERASIL